MIDNKIIPKSAIKNLFKINKKLIFILYTVNQLGENIIYKTTKDEKSADFSADSS